MEKSSQLSRRDFVQRTLGTGAAFGALLILGTTAEDFEKGTVEIPKENTVPLPGQPA